MIIKQIGNRDNGLGSIQEVQEAIDLVSSDTMISAAHTGELSLIIFRPNLSKAIVPGLLDTNAADIDMINYFLHDKFSKFSHATLIHVQLDREFVAELYGRNPRTIGIMQSNPAYPETSNVDGVHNAWDDLLYLMTSGVSTVVLLNGVAGNATSHAREVIGSHQDLTKRNKGLPYSSQGIRPVFARSPHNNLIHGSDSPVGLIEEIGVFKDFLKRSQDSE